MRLWHLPYVYLDSQRLASQHYEAHGLLTVCLKGGRWGAIADQFRQSCDYIVACHDRAATELATRKGASEAHPSPMPEVPPDHRTVTYRPSREEKLTDVVQLRQKWEAEGYFFGMGRLDLRHAERQLGLEPGREWEACLRAKDRTRTFVTENRLRLKELGDKRLGEKLKLLGYEP